MSTPAYWGCPLRDAPFLWCEVHRQSLRPCRSAAERDHNVPMGFSLKPPDGGAEGGGVPVHEGYDGPGEDRVVFERALP